MTLSPPKKSYSSLSEWCFIELRSAVLRGELKPGERLEEVKLSQLLSVSRSPVREACQRLVQCGLAEMIPQKGISIIKLSQDDIMYLIRIREAFESLIVREAVQTITPEQIDHCKQKLLTLLGTRRRQTDGHLDQDEFDFHDFLTEVIKNPFTKSLFSIISNKIKILRIQSRVISARSEHAIEEHLKILDAIEAGDADLAEALARAHAVKSEEKKLAAFSKCDSMKMNEGGENV
jgi:DNA-binding GntR family transcriptional regulator